MRFTIRYLINRLLMFFIVILVAVTINFFVPRMAPGDPISAVLSKMESQGMRIVGGDKIVEAYRELFGLNGTLFDQYIRYVSNTFQFNLGYSISNFPSKIIDMILPSLPWTIGLLTVATIISFILGNFLGAFLAWEQGKQKIQFFTNFIPVVMIFGAIPFYLMGMGLMFIFAYTLQMFPVRGSMSIGAELNFNLSTILDIIYHGTLPAFSIILSGIGHWALGMRGMMISTIGEDYLYLAEAKGIKERNIFWQYATRNAVLPQVTALIMSIGTIVSGSVLVEIIFSYPGLGWLMYQAIGNSDYPLIQGTTFMLVLAVALSVLILDLIYPLLDPRITLTEQ